MRNYHDLRVINYLPLYEWAFPLSSKRNMYHACIGQDEQVLLCDTVKKSSKLIYTCPHDAIILEDMGSRYIYSIYVDSSFCNIENILSNELLRIPLNDSNESVVEARGNLGFIFLKITLDDATEQTSRVLLVDFKRKVFSQINNAVITSSYTLPYIVEQSGSVLAIVEDSIIFPYENAELSKASIDLCKNSVFTTNIGNLFSDDAAQDIPFNEIITCKNSFENYIQILKTYRNAMLVSIGNVERHFTEIMCVDFEGKHKGDTICINDMVWDILEDINGTLHVVAWKNNSVSLYDGKGHIVTVINLDVLYSETPNIECNKVIGLDSKKFVIFDATDYNGKEAVQVRVIFDVIAKSFFIIQSSLVELNDCCL